MPLSNFTSVVKKLVQGPTCEDTCPDGQYGQNCTHVCDCLNNNKCDPVNGMCLCVGWMGDKCERGCPKGFYGPMCSKKCDLCNGISWADSNAACDPITGACKCERGYKGPDCKQRDALQTPATVGANLATREILARGSAPSCSGDLIAHHSVRMGAMVMTVRWNATVMVAVVSRKRGNVSVDQASRVIGAIRSANRAVLASAAEKLVETAPVMAPLLNVTQKRVLV
ncbi:hypothetical protein ANCCEY_08512 [Ancylostoma ceylanicum]|uniref:Laminin EGF-like domain-containing protein n=1 Tax=Ancylostoma ceylanicum TaxID=53326 RepID=A0A0D6LK11_9BILA|nr:hypothetical protein ANCCEY_08512 [Ancylostoma ceylanicum]